MLESEIGDNQISRSFLIPLKNFHWGLLISLELYLKKILERTV